MSDQGHLDNKLAEITDMILEGKTPQHFNELEREIEIVRQLVETIAPDEDIDPKFRNRLTNVLSEEWDQRQRQRRYRQHKRRFIPFNLRTTRGLAVAASFVVVFAVIVLIVVTQSVEGDSLPASAGLTDNSVTALIVVVIFALAAAAGFFMWNKRR